MVVTMLLILSVLTFRPPAERRQVASTDDLSVYKAVLASKIQPEVDRFSADAGIRTPAPVLAFDRTLMVCRPAADHPTQARVTLAGRIAINPRQVSPESWNPSRSRMQSPPTSAWPEASKDPRPPKDAAYASTRITSVSGTTPSWAIASAAAGLRMTAFNASMSGTSITKATLFEFCGSTNVRMLVTPSRPNSSFRFGERSQ